MNTVKTIHVSIVELDEEGREQGGMDFWWSEGSHIYLYQRWEHRAAGNEFYQTLPDPICPDPKGEMNALEYTVRQCWLAQVDMTWKSMDENYS